MKRRSFLRNIGLASMGPLVLNGLPVSAMSKSGQLQQMAANSTNGKVLVLIQLHGGNDGLNTLIPVDQYNIYRSIRPNIAIPDSGIRKYIKLDTTLSDSQQIGLHPDMGSFKELYDKGMASVIQNVGYENINGSHFRSTDIWFTGSDYDEYLPSGWAGRFLDSKFPNFPESYPNSDMMDPLGLEIGSSVSLGFHTDEGVPTAIAVESPDQFYDLLSNVGVNPPKEVENTNYGKELKWIMDIEKKSNQYAGRLKEIYDRGRNSTSANYSPIGDLSAQLKVISRLLSGGCQTRIFLARITGFDTHAKQSNASDNTTGTHARLLKQLFDSVRGFQEELKELGLEDKVLTATFSEFGRRAYSNGSMGTDHGAAAPLFVFGKHVNPGVIGNNPDLNDLDDGNLKYKHDFRQVFGTVLQDWMGADSSILEKTRFTEHTRTPLPIIHKQQAGTPEPAQEFVSERFSVLACFPNPASTHVDVVYQLEHNTPLQIQLIDLSGNVVVEEKFDMRGHGRHKTRLMLPKLPNGIYILHWQAGSTKVTKQVVVQQ